MASRDLKSNISVETTLAPQARTASENGATVDLLNYEAVTFEAIVGTITDSTHNLTVQESDDGTTFTNVAAGDLQGSFSALASNANQEVGYIGYKRYVRVNAAVTNVPTGAVGGVYAVAVVRGTPKIAPI
jgi:hypothetical protein